VTTRKGHASPALSAAAVIGPPPADETYLTEPASRPWTK
jgi:hypothetical protein